MACRISALVFLLLIPETELNWNPSITAVPDTRNKSLVVTVRPVRLPIAYLKVCVSKASSIPCLGKVYLIESPNDTLRYSVKGLPTNQSYFIYVRPYDSKGREVDIWIHKENPIFLHPWPEDPTPTTTTTSIPSPAESTVQPEEAEVKEAVGLEVVVVVVVLAVLLLAALVSIFLCRRGYLQKIWFLRWCSPHSAFNGPPVKVLQLYVKESPVFHRLVRTHMEYLCEYTNLDCMDCEEMRNQQNMDMWLEQASTVLVYLSPQLMKELIHTQNKCIGEDFTQQNPLLSSQVNHILRLASAMAAHEGRRWRRPPIIFILPGCWSADLGSQLSRMAVFNHLPRFSFSSAPGPLLNRLSGGYRCRLTCWSRSRRTQELRNTIRTLVQTIKCSRYDWGVHTNGYMQPGGDCECDDSPLEGNGYTGMGTPHGRQGHHLHHTDSGISSSAPEHHRGDSNSSSEPCDHRVENGEEEGGSERDPMIPEMTNNFVMSSMTIFLPPESVAGEDAESVVIQDEFRKVNRNGDWSN